MFQSYKELEKVRTDVANTRKRYLIIDDTFEEEAIVVDCNSIAIEKAVIQVYERRGLNVVANLVRCIIYMHRNMRRIDISSISAILKWNSNYNPGFKQYEDDVVKDLARYLILL
jgi:hypothetical protein